MKHMQPNSQVYGLMEIKVFKELLAEISVLVENDDLISDNSNITINSNVTSTTTTNTATNTSTSSTTSTTSNSNELKNIATRIATLVKFHWNVLVVITLIISNLNDQNYNKNKTILQCYQP